MKCDLMLLNTVLFETYNTNDDFFAFRNMSDGEFKRSVEKILSQLHDDSEETDINTYMERFQLIKQIPDIDFINIHFYTDVCSNVDQGAIFKDENIVPDSVDPKVIEVFKERVLPSVPNSDIFSVIEVDLVISKVSIDINAWFHLNRNEELDEGTEETSKGNKDEVKKSLNKRISGIKYGIKQTVGFFFNHDFSEDIDEMINWPKGTIRELSNHLRSLYER